MSDDATKTESTYDRPVCDTPGCGRPIPKGGEGYPEICPVCLAALRMHDEYIAFCVRSEGDKSMQGWICVKCRAFNANPSSCRACGSPHDVRGNMSHVSDVKLELASRKLAERHDALRRCVMAIASHLELVAMADEQAKFSGPIVRELREANAKFLRGEAELLRKAVEESEG